VLARCAFVVDGTPVSRRDPATVGLTNGGTIEVLPPFAGGAVSGGASDQPATPAVQNAREPVLAQLRKALGALATPILAVGLLLASHGSGGALAVGLFVVQLLLIVGWFRSAQLTSLGQAVGGIVSLGAAGAADVVLVRMHDRTEVRALAAVLAALVVASFVVQLARRDGRARLTDTLAASIASGALAVAAAVLIAVRNGPDGTTMVAVALVAVAVGVLPLQGTLAWWVSIPVGLVLGFGASLLAGHTAGGLSGGVIAAVAAVAATQAVAARAAMGKSPADVVLWPVVATLPLVVVPTAVFVVARIMVG
ncbi:MAG TPA: hypothetical protein VIL94_09595, partial [Acidothermaceae bacterium]